jgi:hypothetical protein
MTTVHKSANLWSDAVRGLFKRRCNLQKNEPAFSTAPQADRPQVKTVEKAT